MPNLEFGSAEEQLRYTETERDNFEACWLKSRQELAVLKAGNKIVQACSAEIGTAKKISGEGWNRIAEQTGKTRLQCEYRWVEEKKERKRVYDEMHLYDRNQTPPTASYAPDDRLRQPNGRYRRIIFTNIQGVHRTRPRPATIETPERNERRPGCQQNPPARQTPQRAQHCSQGRNQLMSPPSSANVSRTRIGEGAHHTCNIRPCRREPTRNELLQGLRQAAMDDLLRSGMNRHDYAVFLKKMNALKEFGPG